MSMSRTSKMSSPGHWRTEPGERGLTSQWAVAYGALFEGYLRTQHANLGVRDYGVSAGLPGGSCVAPTTEEEKMSGSKFPPGSDEQRVRRVLEHYEAQSDEEAVAEDEAAYESTTETMMSVPIELVPRVRELIASYRGE
jgi:hypothetical protein